MSCPVQLIHLCIIYNLIWTKINETKHDWVLQCSNNAETMRRFKPLKCWLCPTVKPVNCAVTGAIFHWLSEDQCGQWEDSDSVHSICTDLDEASLLLPWHIVHRLLIIHLLIHVIHRMMLLLINRQHSYGSRPIKLQFSGWLIWWLTGW